MEAAAVATTTTVETAATTAVETSTAATTVTAAMLGESGDRQANESKRNDHCKKSFEQGGFPHISSLHRNGGWVPGRANRLY
jgi:hypothetical protein